MIGLFEFTSQSLQVVSSEPVAIRRVSGENMAELTQLVWALIANIKRRLFSWKTFMFLSYEPESSRAPSSDSETVLTGAE